MRRIAAVRRAGAVLVAVLVAALAAGCSASGDAPSAVASFYPLAYAAERVAGPGWRVVDLTPPGTEAHDVELSLEDRAAVDEADVLLYLGDIGFQPQVEEAADPHAWLDPRLFAVMVDRVADGLAAADVEGSDGFRERAADLRAELEALDNAYRDQLEGCRADVMVVSHEAFGYLAEAYGLRQIGLTGLSPEAEPTIERLGEAGAALESGEAGAGFFEAGGGARRIAESVASDFGVPALPLGTLESEPPSGGYLSVMEDNLESLREGLGCG